MGMPLRPLELDLREPLSDRLMRAFSALEDLETGDSLIVVLDQDPQSLLNQLRPVLERGFTYWMPEAGPKTWRVIVTRESS